MGNMADTAHMATACMMMHDFGMDKAKDDSERMSIAARVGAQASIIYDKPLAPEHQNLDIDKVRYDALTWLDHQHVFKELVIQTLRVANSLEYLSRGQVPGPTIGASVLERYKNHSPEDLNPDAYQALLSKAIDPMPSQWRKKLQDWRQRNI